MSAQKETRRWRLTWGVMRFRIKTNERTLQRTRKNMIARRQQRSIARPLPRQDRRRDKIDNGFLVAVKQLICQPGQIGWPRF